MRRNAWCRCSILAVLMLAALPAAAHDVPAAAAVEGGFQTDVAADLERTGQKIVALAEAIPADQYGWRPGEGVRSVSEVFIHLATTNQLIPPGLGAAPPDGVALPKDMSGAMAWMLEREAATTAKDDVLRELRQSIDYATAAVKAMATPALEETMDLFGFPASRRAYVLILLTHNHEHLGQAIAYARSLGVTPPWSEAPPAPAAEGEAGEASGD